MLQFRGSMAIKDKIGSWQNNAYVYNSPKGYSSLKKLLGAEFPLFINSFGANDTIQNSIPPVSIFFSSKLNIILQI